MLCVRMLLVAISLLALFIVSCSEEKSCAAPYALVGHTTLVVADTVPLRDSAQIYTHNPLPYLKIWADDQVFDAMLTQAGVPLIVEDSLVAFCCFLFSASSHGDSSEIVLDSIRALSVYYVNIAGKRLQPRLYILDEHSTNARLIPEVVTDTDMINSGTPFAIHDVVLAQWSIVTTATAYLKARDRSWKAYRQNPEWRFNRPSGPRHEELLTNYTRRDGTDT